jgi:hypothetical protein
MTMVVINKLCDLWVINLNYQEPLLAETKQEAELYVKQWIIKEYELPPETEIQERYFSHRQTFKYWVEGVERDDYLAYIEPISWA